MDEDKLIPAKKLFKGFAARVSKETEAQVVLADQSDTAFAWQGTFIHPLQPLENSHQQASREAVWKERDLEKHREVSGQEIGRYFGFSSSSPELMGSDQTDDFEENFKEARQVASTIASVIRAYSEPDSPQPSTNTLTALGAKLREAIGDLWPIFGEFELICNEFGVPKEDIPIIPEIEKHLNDATSALNGTVDLKVLSSCLSTHLKPAMQALKSMQTGLACVQTFHVIEPFYLYRLLVKYQVKANSEIEEDTKRHVSGNLTDIFNNEQPWIQDWLEEKMRTLDAILAKRDDDVAFHLKGGRALYFALHDPDKGKNDWDTSVLINPKLNAQDWYKKLGEIHNKVLKQLQRYKREFFVLAHKKENIERMRLSLEPKENEQEVDVDSQEQTFREAADVVEARVRTIEPLEDPDPSALGAATVPREGEPLFFRHQAGTKAELIDIGIARRATAELIGQWHHVYAMPPGLINTDWTRKVPIPGHRYYLDEYLEMIREAYDEPKTKVEKRVNRLAEILKLSPELDTDDKYSVAATIEAAKDRVDGGKLKDCLNDIKALGPECLAEQRILTVLLEEFYTSLELSSKQGLAEAFKRQFQAKLKEKDYLANSSSVAKCISKLKPGNKEILERIGFAHKLSEDTLEHRKNRASYFGFLVDGHMPANDLNIEEAKARRVTLGNFVKSLYTATLIISPKDKANVDKEKEPFTTKPSTVSKFAGGPSLKSTRGLSPFRPDSELSVQFAVSGAFAAFLHADYAANFAQRRGRRRVPKELRDKLAKDLEPVNTIDIKLYSGEATTSQVAWDFVYGAMIEKALDTYIHSNYTPAFKMEDIDSGKLLLWPDKVKIDQFGSEGYEPAIARIQAVTGFWPQLSFIWGYPVLSLPSLIEEYDLRAEHTLEYGVKKELKQTSDLLRALLTFFE